MVHGDEHPLAPSYCGNCGNCGELKPYWVMGWNSIGCYWCLLCRVKTDTYVIENELGAEPDRIIAS